MLNISQVYSRHFTLLILLLITYQQAKFRSPTVHAISTTCLLDNPVLVKCLQHGLPKQNNVIQTIGNKCAHFAKFNS